MQEGALPVLLAVAGVAWLAALCAGAVAFQDGLG